MREDTLGALADHAVYKTYRGEERHRKRPSMILTMHRETLSGAIAGILGLTKGIMTDFITPEGHRNISKTENQQHSMLRTVKNNLTDRKWNPIGFENRFSHKIMDIALPPRYVKRMTKVWWDDQNFVAPVVAISRKETEKAMDVESKREDGCQKIMDAAFSINARSALLTDGPPTNISDEKRNEKRYVEISEERAPEPSPCNELMAGRESIWCTVE